MRPAARPQVPLSTLTPLTRLALFGLGATSISGLILHFYSLAPIRWFTFGVTVPAFLLLLVLWLRGRDPALRSAIAIGALSGVIACIAYDLFRLPFVLLQAHGSQSALALPLFKVFPRFGALLLGQNIEQAVYSPAAHILGWAYHFSNAIGFGVIYIAAIRDPRQHHWAWAVCLALMLEGGLLLMPYPEMFSIPVTAAFVLLTASAHLVFGCALGLTTRWLAQRQPA
jgi:hypothetical protein